LQRIDPGSAPEAENLLQGSVSTQDRSHSYVTSV
jgi:hypothetical protein